jgi:hypothetical protein
MWPGRTCAGWTANTTSPRPPTLLREGGEVIGFCSWREGLVLRPERADQICGIPDLAGSGLRLVNREPGAEARSLLDRELADAGIDSSQLPGYGTRADGHLQVVAAIAAGLADAGVASEPAALAYDLVFIPARLSWRRNGQRPYECNDRPAKTPHPGTVHSGAAMPV